ncbi:MAG: phage portal protein [Oscillospiraceae bacterium]|nr:phage portal protein [Oscillospiraceae bacterium]
MLSVQEIKTFMDNDAASIKKRLAKEGQRYYEADHDIRDYRIFFVNADGMLEEDKTKSNIKISHPFFTELVDQEVQYMLSGKDGFVRSDDPNLQEQLDAYFNDNEDFTAELEDLLTGCVSKGFEYAYAYKNADDKLAFKCADSLGVVEVRAKETDDGCEYVIYWYVDRIGKDNKKIKRIQVWDKTQTYYYVEEENGGIVPDDSETQNPRPHIMWTEGDDGKIYYEDFGVIPFFRLDNCKKQFSGLKPIKSLIDDYDLMSCGLSNNLQDTAEALYVVKGFEGDNLDELMVNIKAKKHIGVSDDGGVEVHTVDVPYQARQTKLDLDEKNIYRFGMGFNSAQMGDGNITNVVIKSRYALLDLKCNKLEIRLKQFMRKLLKVVLKEINDANGTDYQQKDVYFNFEREVMTNAADNAQIELTDAQKQQTQINTLLMLATRLDNETLMQNICEVLDIEYNEIKDKLPEPEEMDDPYQAANMLNTLPTEPDEGDLIE